MLGSLLLLCGCCCYTLLYKYRCCTARVFFNVKSQSKCGLESSRLCSGWHEHIRTHGHTERTTVGRCHQKKTLKCTASCCCRHDCHNVRSLRCDLDVTLRRNLIRTRYIGLGLVRPPAATIRRLTPRGYYSRVNYLAINAAPRPLSLIHI